VNRRPPRPRLDVDQNGAGVVERDAVRRLTRWAAGLYKFQLDRRSELLRVDGGPPVWPFRIRVRAGLGPSLAALLDLAGAGAPLPWWAELQSQAPRESAWLIWRSAPSRRWLLSCWSLGALHVPVRFAVLPTTPGWPRFTVALDAFLYTVKVEQVVAAIAEGWGVIT
jgi:hypothetical protein